MSSRVSSSVERAAKVTKPTEKPPQHGSKALFSRVHSNNGTPSASDHGSHANGAQPTSPNKMQSNPGDTAAEGKPAKLRLGMMGVGGYRAVPDEVGWKGEWPDYQKTRSEADSKIRAAKEENGHSGGQKIAPKPVSSACSCSRSDQASTNGSHDNVGPQEPNSLAQSDTSYMNTQYQTNGSQTPKHPSYFNPNQSWSQPSIALPDMTGFSNHREPNQYQGNSFACAAHLHSGFSGASAHNCLCGENCACLGCAAHPQNETTLNYIRENHQLMMDFPEGSPSQMNFAHMQAYVQQAPYMMANQSTLSYNNPQLQAQYNAATSGNILHKANMFSLGLPHSTDQFVHNMPNMSWQASSTTQPGQSLHNGSTPSVELGPPRFERSNTSIDEPLSPSSFFLQQLVLPSCNDASGTCHCGDGCTCVGCLTHGGHSGVPLEMSADVNDQPEFKDFG